MTQEDLGKVSHLADRRRAKAQCEDLDQAMVDKIADALDIRVARHFQHQNDILLTSIKTLVGELDGVRSGKAEHAFAKVASPGCEADLPTMGVDAAIIYKHTADEIGAELGLTASQVGTLLGPGGLGWAGNPAYQEVDRYKKGRQKFWHWSVPEKLRSVLSAPSGDQIANAAPRIRAIVRKWRKAHGLAEVAAIAVFSRIE